MMYWFYLILFVLAVITPEIIRSDAIYFLGEERTEELIIFVLGVLAFMIFLWEEKRAIKNTQEKTAILRKMNQISKDLTQSYSYIGELNRKLEILHGVDLNFPKETLLSKNKEDEVVHSILTAIETLAGTDQFCLCFKKAKSGEILKEMKLRNEFSFSEKNMKGRIKNNNRSLPDEDVTVIKSDKEIDGVTVHTIIAKRRLQLSNDLEAINSLSRQALFFYAAMERVRNCKT